MDRRLLGKPTLQLVQWIMKMMRLLKGFILLGLTTGTAIAAPRPVVVELFTSQACSDCPPADALLSQVQAHDPDILALDLHVTYWDGAAWTDPYSLRGATDLQNYYASLRGSTEVYTPEAVVDGQAQFVGSDRHAMRAAIERARAKIGTGSTVPVSVEEKDGRVTVHVGPGAGAASVWLFGFDTNHTTRVLGGENGGATLREVNVVRSITKLGSWNSEPMVRDVPAPAGTKFAVVVQRTDGAILGAAEN
jgi:hypothetical protein